MNWSFHNRKFKELNYLGCVEKDELNYELSDVF